MEQFWTENKKTIGVTAVCAVVVLLIIKFFDVIFLGGVVIALAVAAVLAWRHVATKYGGPEEALKALLRRI